MPDEAQHAPALPARSPLAPLALPFAALFVISGACGLTYEVVWSRFLHEVFGVTAFAVSTVLISFMGGMALGAALLGRRADRSRRPLRMFAWLEAGIGLYALAFPLFVAGVQWIHAFVFPVLPDSFLLRSLIRFVLCMGLLLVPTTLMGGTLPALGRGLLRRRERVGLGVGFLYFVNTAGAAIGCYLAGFALIPQLGLRTTTLVAAVLNFGVAGIALILDRGQAAGDGERIEKPEPTRDKPLTVPENWPLIVAFGSGFTALAFEIVWFRILVLVFGSTVYSFAAMLSVFLLGLALGSLIMGPLADRARAPARLLAATQGAAALFALAGSLMVNAMPTLFLELYSAMGFTFDGMNRTKLILCVVTLLPAALAFGGTFPVAVRLARSTRGTGSRIGGVYAWNTAGAILGSFTAGFVLLPTVGSEITLTLVVTIALVLAFGSLLSEPGPIRLGWGLPAGLVIIVMTAILVLAPPWNRIVLNTGVFFAPERYFDGNGEVALEPVIGDHRLDSFTEGYTGMIAGMSSPRGKLININGSTTASDQFEDMLYQRLLGHLPVALHPGPTRQACIVGLGAGVTAGAVGLHDLERLTAVELERGVKLASRYFENENHHVLDNEILDLRVDDGRNFLQLTEERYDVISSAPNFPSLAGAGALYTTDFFDLCRSRLAPDGVMCQFVPVWKFLPRDVKTIVGSFSDVFPHVRVFSVGVILVMLGRETPFPETDLQQIAARLDRPDVSASLAEIGIREPIDLLSSYLFDEEEARRYSENAPRNTDDHPVIEFFSPEGLFESTVSGNLGELLALAPEIEDRADRLGLEGSERESFLAAATRHEQVTAAVGYLWAGNVPEAMERLMPAAESGHRVARHYAAATLEKLGHGHETSGRFDIAAEQYRLALRFEPDRLDTLLGLGQAALILGQLDEARTVLEHAWRLHPDSGPTAELVGWLEFVQGRPEVAEPVLRRAIELAPWRPTSYAILGEIVFRRGAAPEALALFEAAEERGNRGEAVMVGTAAALLSMGRAEEAFERARVATAVHANSYAAFETLRRAAAEAGHTAAAESAGRRADELRRQLEAGAAPPTGQEP
jgi:spermidine synthase